MGVLEEVSGSFPDRVDHAYDRHPRAESLLHHIGYFLGMHDPDAAPQDSSVLRPDKERPSVNFPVSGDDPVRGDAAGLVVQYGDGRVETRCIQFEEESISGADLLAKSGLDVAIDASSGLGITVCQIAGQGCDYPAERCFCQCSGTGSCAYWNYFYRDPDQAGWVYAALGALRHQAQPGSVEAWVWGNGQTPAADLTFEAVCQPEEGLTPLQSLVTPELPALGTPDRPTAQPQAITPTPTAGPSPQPARPTQDTSPPPITPPASPATTSYWLFGGMGLVLLLVGAVVWLRSRR